MRCLRVESRQPVNPGLARQIRLCPAGLEDPLSMEQHRRRQFIEGLRAVAQFYETNPDAWYDGMHLTLNMYVWGRAARKALADTARALGQCNKVYDDTNITVSRHFSEQVTLAVFAARARVCRRVVLGDRILPARTLPATEEVRIPASRVEIVEWLCDPLLQQDAGV
jgi:hypothetical protein